jgi:hypothetical protein
MPMGWGSDLNWGSNASIWDNMRGPGDPPKASSKKQKKWGIEHPSYGTLAILEKVTRDYLVLEGQQRMKKGATRATKCTRTKASATMVTADQLDCELASA